MSNPKGYRPACHYCGGKATTRDHVVPRSRGGTNKPQNLVPACEPCNKAKADKWPTCDCWHCTRAKDVHLHLTRKVTA